MVTIFGPSCFVVFDKRNYLAEVYFDLSRKDECLKELVECKRICEVNEMTNMNEYT
jgi:hypothetical protein